MASLLRSKKKVKNNKPVPLSEPAPRDVELVTVDSEGKLESYGSQVSVREADRENATDTTAIDNTCNSKSEEKGKKGGKGKKNMKEKKGGNLGLAKPAWRGASLEKGNGSSEKRTSTPVEAIDKGDNLVSSSTASIQSSMKEAWSDDGISKSGSKSQKAKQTGSVVSLKAAKNERNRQDGDSASLLSEKSIVRRGDNQSEQHAYVPYVYARDCVARITADMTQMKANHVKIVQEIGTNYHHIEDETQSQFNTFILLLRTEYSGKVKTFRQVIEAHRAELEHKQHYWDDMLQSLTQRNNQLLNDKKSLLIKNKVEMERLEKEKNEAVDQLSQKLESAQAAMSNVEKERSLELDQYRQALDADHIVLVSRLQEEKKVLEDQLESEKAEIESLQKQLKERPVPILTSVDEGDSSSPQREVTAPVAAVVGHDRLKQERQTIETEREKMATEREALQQAQGQLRRDLDSLRDDLTDSRKDAAEWKTKYSVMQPQLQDYGRLSAAYTALKEQYSVLATVTAATAGSSADSKQAAQDSLKNMETEVTMMSEARDSTQTDIDKWEKDFEKKNGRAPTEEDKSDSVKEMYTSLGEVNLMLGSLERKKETLQKLESGEVPEVKAIPQSTTPVAEPIIKTVEVEVPDPRTAQELEASVALAATLRAEITQITADNARLQGEATDLEVALSDAQEEIAALKAGGIVIGDSPDTQEYEEKITKLERDLMSTTDEMMREKTAHDLTRDELEAKTARLRVTTDELQTKTLGLNSEIETAKATAKAEIKAKDVELASMTARLSELENERLSKLPPDTAKEIKQLRARITHLEKERNSSITTSETAEAKLMEVSTKLGAITAALETQRSANREAESKLKKSQSEKEKSVRELTSQVQKKEQQRLAAEKNLAALEKKMKTTGVERESTTVGQKGGVAVVAGASDSGLKRENVELKRRVKDLEAEVKRAGKVAGAAGAAGETAAADRQAMKKNEKILKELEKKLDMEIRKREKHEQNLKIKEEELNSLQKESDKNKKELASAQGELSVLGVSAKEGLAAAEKAKALEADVKRLTDENKTLTENFNSERVLRKKYYNMVEDMKGKIRVYCRARPLSNTEKSNGNYEVVKSPDEFSVQVESSRGLKEFQFDQVFTGECSQEKIFEDTHNLIQSAVDGFNVCIFAYGQTGSGKTFTMIGDRGQQFPGVAPRAFDRIFEVIEENKSKYSFKVSSYMLELYNDHLIDLYGKTNEDKLDIRKDQQGLVFVSGAAVKKAVNSKELFALFEEGSKNRHVASTKMNAESSRSHLIIAVVIESTNLATGQVTRGKLSLVDLAGSERVGKTEASAEQLKEAMSINKSLSALGDVISALSSEQSFIPYRNNKLTLLMQDSLGGNAKTLMFVNISPANYNCDESIISLTYASRVKLITNSAQKNADNKEIARLKDIINKLKQGEEIQEDV